MQLNVKHKGYFHNYLYVFILSSNKIVFNDICMHLIF
jgi:hypothetical protein